MKNVLITGGPVYAYLDDVKIITNRFKGGLMADLAEKMIDIHESGLKYYVTYLSSKDAKKPPIWNERRIGPRGRRAINLVYAEHDGFDDYMDKVLQLALQMDVIILGAAVANLIPQHPIKGKFPSHNYKEGDTIPINFTIAPRVINKIRQVAPKALLCGFKLLSGVSHDELIHAAYTVLLESGANVVFANDATNLQQIFAVTKERAVHPIARDDLAAWISQMAEDEYYRTMPVPDCPISMSMVAIEEVKSLISLHHSKFITVEEGYVFGTIAVRVGDSNEFITTGRGKRELDNIVHVFNVNHQSKEVYANNKATLNAPLLARIFENKQIYQIVHFHQQKEGLPTLEYAPPGTVRDSNRKIIGSFNINRHGCFLLFNSKGEML
jgi:hypothetical protein